MVNYSKFGKPLFVLYFTVDQLLITLLDSGDKEVVYIACGVLCIMIYISVDQLLITLLDSGDKEVVYIACGVLINFMVDEENRAVLKSEGGITK